MAFSTDITEEKYVSLVIRYAGQMGDKKRPASVGSQKQVSLMVMEGYALPAYHDGQARFRDKKKAIPDTLQEQPSQKNLSKEI